MIVCLCKGVNDRRIREEIRAGARSVAEIRQSCSAGSDCGACITQIRQLLGTVAAAARSDDSRRG
jgi:bacterioferritin-associated ferredoxin